MALSSEKVLLDITQYFLQAIGDESTQSHFISLALNALAPLLNCPLITISSIYHDNSNNELVFKHYLKCQQTAQLVIQPNIKFLLNDKNTPRLINDILYSTNQLEVTFIDFNHILFNEHLTLSTNDIESHDKTSCDSVYIVPFFHQAELIGIVSYQVNIDANFKQLFTVIYQAMKVFFINEYENTSTKIRLKTFQTVLDLMPQRVFWKNKDSVYQGCNQAFANDAHVSTPADIVGVTDFDIFPEQAALYRSDDANTMTTRKHLINSEEPQTHQNGKTIWLRTSKRPIITDVDTVVGVVGTYDDISQLKDIQQELNQAKHELEARVIERTQELYLSKTDLEDAINNLKSAQSQIIESEKMAALGNLVAGIAHEINTPIGIAVTGSSHLVDLSHTLKKMVTSGIISKSQFIEYIDNIVSGGDIILRNLERASELVRNFKMIAVDQTKDDKRQINFYQYLHDVISAMTPRTNQKNIQVHLTGDQAFFFNTYPGAIAQIITNFIENTINHAFCHSDNGQINIDFEIVDATLKLEFKDNGMGISKKLLNKIFEPFYTTKRGKGGSGLGLSIIYNIVTQRLGGNIVCESKENEWTKFILVIPVQGK